MADSVGHAGLTLPPLPIPKMVNWLLEGLYSPSKPLYPLYFATLSLQYLAVCKGILALASKEQSFCSWLVRFPQSEMPHGDRLAGSSCKKPVCVRHFNGITLAKSTPVAHPERLYGPQYWPDRQSVAR